MVTLKSPQILIVPLLFITGTIGAAQSQNWTGDIMPVHSRLPSSVSTFSLRLSCQLETIYLDDILVTGGTAEEHMKNLSCVLSKLDLAGARLNKAKCSFMVSRREYLGHVIDKDGLHPD